MAPLRSIETSKSTRPTIRRHVSEGLRLQRRSCENLVVFSSLIFILPPMNVSSNLYDLPSTLIIIIIIIIIIHWPSDANIARISSAYEKFLGRFVAKYLNKLPNNVFKVTQELKFLFFRICLNVKYRNLETYFCWKFTNY
jgi:hypothetical protein